MNIVFDWSGTISNDILPVYETVMKTFEHFGRPRISFDEFRESYTLPYMVHARMFGVNCSKEELDAVFARYFRQFGFPRPIPSANSTLSELKKRGVRMVVFSCHRQSMLEEENSKYFGENYFDAIYGSISDKELELPAVLAKSRFNPADTIIVGDTEHDILAGKKARIRTAAVLSGYRSRRHLESAGPDFIFEDVSGLLSIF